MGVLLPYPLPSPDRVSEFVSAFRDWRTTRPSGCLQISPPAGKQTKSSWPKSLFEILLTKRSAYDPKSPDFSKKARCQSLTY